MPYYSFVLVHKYVYLKNRTHPQTVFSFFVAKILLTMADAGAMPPPPGTGMPDVNRGPEILIVCGILTAISFLFLVVRYYVRISMTKDVAWDDWTCLISWVRNRKAWLLHDS